MKTLKEENIRSSILTRAERKLFAEKIIDQLEAASDELNLTDQKNLSILKGLLEIENTLEKKENTYKAAIEQNEAMIAYHQKLHDNLIRLNKITIGDVYIEVSRYADELIIKYQL